ncbi:MAG TPA: hypothetical protein VGC38_00415, partial [Pseudolabrys sp.]
TRARRPRGKTRANKRFAPAIRRANGNDQQYSLWIGWRSPYVARPPFLYLGVEQSRQREPCNVIASRYAQIRN